MQALLCPMQGPLVDVYVGGRTDCLKAIVKIAEAVQDRWLNNRQSSDDEYSDDDAGRDPPYTGHSKRPSSKSKRQKGQR